MIYLVSLKRVIFAIAILISTLTFAQPSGEKPKAEEELGGKLFVDVSKKMGIVDTHWSGDAAFADLNRDGYPVLPIEHARGR